MGYQDLDVWKLGRELAKEAYRLTAGFPKSEQFGIIAQIRRAAVSIPANIAEGYGRKSAGSFAQFLRVAKGSLNELETLLVLSWDLGFLQDSVAIDELIRRTGSMLTSLISKIEGNVVKEIEAMYDPLAEPGT